MVFQRIFLFVSVSLLLDVAIAILEKRLSWSCAALLFSTRLMPNKCFSFVDLRLPQNLIGPSGQ